MLTRRNCREANRHRPGRPGHRYANVNRPTGTLYGPQRNFVVQTSGQLMAADEYRPIPVAYRNGSPVG